MQSLVSSLEGAGDVERQGVCISNTRLPFSFPPFARASCMTCVRPLGAAAALAKLEELQMKDTLRMFNGLVERCFGESPVCHLRAMVGHMLSHVPLRAHTGECVSAFRSKALTGPEEKCVSTCAEKFLKHSVCCRSSHVPR